MRIVMVGAGGHGKVCAEVAELNGYEEILFLDSHQQVDICDGHRVVYAGDDGYEAYLDKDTEFFVSIGNANVRRRIQEKIELAGGKMALLIHPDAVISKNVRIGRGSVVMAGAVINAGTVAGKGVIVNTASSIDHDCEVCDYCHIAVGAHLCGTVAVGAGTWIGAGATVSNNVSIAGGCMVGAGAVVVRDIEEDGVYVGVPAKKRQED